MRLTRLLVLLVVLSISSQANAFWGLYDNPDDDYTKTGYPIVLVHGTLGFDHTDIVGFIETDYWPTIPYEIMRSGGTVYVAQVSAINSPEIRGEQLIHELEVISALTGHEKFNLIGHSFGAPTSRYAAAVRPDLIASVSTVGGSNDSDERDNPNPEMNPDDECDIACQLMELAVMGAGMNWTVPQSTSDVHSGLASLREAAEISNIAANSAFELYGFPIDASTRTEFEKRQEYFNRVYPDGRPTEWCGEGPAVGDNGIGYYSWSGAQLLTNPFDPSDIVMLVAGAASVIEGNATDGLVSACESRWGQVLRADYPMNHLDETNLLWGLSNPFFNEVALFRQHANRLKNAGY